MHTHACTYILIQRAVLLFFSVLLELGSYFCGLRMGFPSGEGLVFSVVAVSRNVCTVYCLRIFV